MEGPEALLALLVDMLESDKTGRGVWCDGFTAALSGCSVML